MRCEKAEIACEDVDELKTCVFVVNDAERHTFLVACKLITVTAVKTYLRVASISVYISRQNIAVMYSSESPVNLAVSLRWTSGE